MRNRAWVAMLPAVVVAAVGGCRRAGTNESLPRSSPVSTPYFEEVPPHAAPDFVHRPRDIKTYFMPDVMGSGGAFLDFDGDDDLDILLLNGAPAGSEAGVASGCRLYRNDPGLVYTDVTRDAGLTSHAYTIGVAVGDIDNDGDLDFYVTAYGPDELWRNNGDGTFTEVAHSVGIANERWGTAASFCDFDRDGWLDLFVVNYIDFYPGIRCEDGSGRPDYCNPLDLPGVVDRLYRNKSAEGGPLRFVDVTVEAGLTAHRGRGLGACCRDFDGDMRPDIYVANDMNANHLWIQQPDGTFRDDASMRGVAYNFFGEAESSMGVDLGDYNDDAQFDIFLTHLRGQTNTLYQGHGGGIFTDVTAKSGLGPIGLAYTSFGVASFDLEHDGDLDLVIVNGLVAHAPGVLKGTEFWDAYAATNHVFRNDGSGHFEDISQMAGSLTRRVEVSRALACGDIDGDGDVDLLATHCGGPARLYLNQVPKEGSWLILRAFDPALKRDALGARIVVRAGTRLFRRELNPSTSYLTSHDSRVHIGLGKAVRYDEISVLWPDGVLEIFPEGNANRYLTLDKGSGSSRTSAREATPSEN
ncbi:MAG: CRTAC1 family protein [Pirellulaceae bacterium]